MVTLRNAALEISIASLGAEMLYLRDARGRDFLWNGDPAWWPGRAPLLFPVVGRVPQDHILVDGQPYPMRQHGLARLSEFILVESAPETCTFRLESSIASRIHYPFEFQLDVIYRLEGAKLHWHAEVLNRGGNPMPFALGFHPAFRWPLPGSAGQEGHIIVFDQPEPAPIRQLRDGLMLESPRPSPVKGQTLDLTGDLFAADALIFDHLASRGVTYRAPQSSVRVTFPGMPHLGLWSKPGANFVCIEPWHGYAAPEHFAGELADKPGMSLLAPGAKACFGLTISLEDA